MRTPHRALLAATKVATGGGLFKRCAALALVGLLGGGVLGCREPPPPEDEEEPVPGPPRDLNFLFVHGVESCEGSRLNAHRSLDELAAALSEALPARLAAHSPGRALTTFFAHANIYTARGSGATPTDSTDPVKLDDWEVGDPGCATGRQGEPCTTAYEWRYRLAAEINRRFPLGTRNIVLLGHSTGARAAMEVTANVGPDGVGTYDWGVSDRIAGVVSLHGMIDGLGSSAYNAIGGDSFLSTCKKSDFLIDATGGCPNGNGWCEYASSVDGTEAAEWVAQKKHALMLSSWASCTPALWTGYSDGLLPYDAQATPSASGLAMTPAPGETWRPVHGVTYGTFCHSDPVKGGRTANEASVASARDQILDWLFAAAPQPSAGGHAATSGSLAHGATTAPFAIPASCAGATAAEARLAVVGVCHHPGFFDGSDHPVDASELSISPAPDCGGTFSWTQQHDPEGAHAADFWWKAQRARGGVLESLTF